ncbi:hypothetical protein RO3G_15826 [Rhizopus delemar RA 99-880]|uniref:Cytochrome b5 heme-binding domain-containing protein n=1 Tax=Rhizopus delemar (strain RA 99-880 / ATCC MYA-4621 / FGSC 9543 / NRRL 43880) TaxID=246409 RepID=I1CRN5_RHIO9|nr:hypothetical protein RO3G_15826 [Rhizopus delemar RA 99-880]|eukprot:EIE91115.1 hypothetical protein RO3G_15826 [Rhizopus delemar RA 99-880]
MDMSKVFTLKEIETHNSLKSLWVIFNGRVYDITEFVKDHPGGDDLLLQYAGQDITEVMYDKDHHEHSEASYEILQDYMIDPQVDVKTHQFLDLNKPLVPQMLTKQFTRAHYLEQWESLFGPFWN